MNATSEFFLTNCENGWFSNFWGFSHLCSLSPTYFQTFWKYFFLQILFSLWLLHFFEVSYSQMVGVHKKNSFIFQNVDKYLFFSLNFFLIIIQPFFESMNEKWSPSGGLEPPTYRLTVERASQLRHEGSVIQGSKIYIQNLFWVKKARSRSIYF